MYNNRFKKELWHEHFQVNFEKVFRRDFSRNTSE